MRAIDTPHVPGASLSGQLEHDPEKACPGLDPGGGNRFSENIMRNETATIDTRSGRSA